MASGRRFRAIAGLVLMTAAPAVAQDTGPTLLNVGCASGPCVLEPFAAVPAGVFLRRGLPLQDERQDLAEARLRRYVEAAAAFPDAVSCLEDAAEAGPQGLDLAAFDWRAHETVESLEVCLSRVANAIGDAARVEAWLASEGFQVAARTMPEGHFRAGWTLMDATWSGEGPFPAKVESWARRLFFGGGAVLSLSLDPGGAAQDVTVDLGGD